MAQKVTWEEIGQKGFNNISPAYKSNGHIFTAGNVGLDPVTNELPEDVEQQTINALENLKNLLEKSGSSLDRVMKVLLFISDRASGPIVNKVYAKYFPHSPARTCVMVQFPDEAFKVELEAIAEYDE
ncbi:hypothetical protein WICPIJ_004533 [Wickerhamomyces pijperi]|uniref:Uncharacterized protein n=1 Tax=Wickerhamomyces pijperi TaxID=599730 RepID=A0A9P8TMT8_WICPI|nr:hypothetical protein WICPIJ_004533 [Wickerhamomyces pijperi]